ncbi:NADPH oxidase activator 1-like [Alosa pseudoharengus]|uniref:NADPH oxidase activator 1-like n=1 Tax=Alosa pseudoharengus TaxID=34774 RepID=UPI003F8A33C8
MCYFPVAKLRGHNLRGNQESHTVNSYLSAAVRENLFLSVGDHLTRLLWCWECGAMSDTELLRFWDEAVKAVDARDWQGVLAKLDDINKPTARTLFATAAAHLALGQLQPAIQALDQTIAKDERLAVGFFQRAGVLLLANRPEEALADCIWAKKQMRENAVIDYRQLGLCYKLYSWQVLYNAAAVHVRMGHWDKARDILLAAAEEKGGARGGTVEAALNSISRREVLAPLLVPEGDVFRPRKEEVEQLKHPIP